MPLVSTRMEIEVTHLTHLDRPADAVRAVPGREATYEGPYVESWIGEAVHANPITEQGTASCLPGGVRGQHSGVPGCPARPRKISSLSRRLDFPAPPVPVNPTTALVLGRSDRRHRSLVGPLPSRSAFSSECEHLGDAGMVVRCHRGEVLESTRVEQIGPAAASSTT